MKTRSKRVVVGYQRWDSILLVHYRVPVQAVRSLVHPRLSIDLHEGSAWVSLTPFTLLGGRLRGMPPLPRVSSFHELNVRTYVHLDGHEPGIWFFSLDATSLISTLVARASLALPYYWCSAWRSDTGTNGSSLHEYECVRRRSDGKARFNVCFGVTGPERTATPGGRDDFLLGRFRLYSTRARGLLVTQSIWHPEWRFSEAKLYELDQTLTDYDGLPQLGRPELAHYSNGVDVEFFPPRPVLER